MYMSVLPTFTTEPSLLAPLSLFVEVILIYILDFSLWKSKSTGKFTDEGEIVYNLAPLNEKEKRDKVFAICWERGLILDLVDF